MRADRDHLVEGLRQARPAAAVCVAAGVVGDPTVDGETYGVFRYGALLFRSRELQSELARRRLLRAARR